MLIYTRTLNFIGPKKSGVGKDEFVQNDEEGRTNEKKT